jgi:hypothetical protein
MFRSRENMARIVNAHRIVGWRVEHQQRFTQIGDVLGKVLLRDVVKEGAANMKGSTGDRHFDLALLADIRHVLLEQPGDMRGIEGRRNGRDHARPRDAMRSSEDRGTAEAVSDQDRGRGERLAQMIGRRDQIVDI